MSQTFTETNACGLPSKQALLSAYQSKPLASLRTPAFVLDRAIFARNCALMHENAMQWGANFRAHLKTHKTAEGTRLQLVSSSNQTEAVVVSTLMEAWQVARSGLVADGIVKDILYGLPIGINKIEDISGLWDEIAEHGAVVRLLVDHPDQIRALEAFEKQRAEPRRWSVFVKVDGGQRRAGVSPASPAFESFLTMIFESPAISLYGFYSHASDAYGSTSLNQASSFLSSEVEAVNTAAGLALAILSGSPSQGTREQPLVLSVGSTPSAHAASAITRSHLASLLHGTLELHAGNYPILDLQQLHTGLIQPERIAHRVLATVISYYPGRGQSGEDEALCDAGAIAMSKDTGPSGGFGEVVGKPWRLGRISQEHGVLTRTESAHGAGDAEMGEGDGNERLDIGTQVQIIGQHACLVAAAHPWYYIVDSDLEGGQGKVVDIWVPWKGW